jgi:hypothetical protein
MQSIVLEPTNYSPYVMFEPDGSLSLKGRSLMLDAVSFYQPLIEWASLLISHAVTFTIELDYFNTSSSRKLLELMKVIDDNSIIQEFNVIWSFENHDEDILEKGHIFEEKLIKARFLYKKLAGV